MSIHFYSVPTWRCSVHRDKPAAFEIRGNSDRYRFACTQACADKQIAELERRGS